MVMVNNQWSLNPFEVREVLQGAGENLLHPYHVSIPLKSGRCCKLEITSQKSGKSCLNPFEVREVLQANRVKHVCLVRSLNPFEVREVLQVGQDSEEKEISSQSL